MISSLRNNWPEYLMEGWALGTFLFSAGVFAVYCFIRAPLSTKISMGWQSDSCSGLLLA